MTLPRTAAEVLSGHVTMEVRCIDRVLRTFRQPRLQYGQGIHGFFRHHRGNQFASRALMMPGTRLRFRWRGTLTNRSHCGGSASRGPRSSSRRSWPIAPGTRLCRSVVRPR